MCHGGRTYSTKGYFEDEQSRRVQNACNLEKGKTKPMAEEGEVGKTPA